MQNAPNSQPWWKTANPETLDDRVNAVQNVNDPTIMADDILRAGKIALIALLAFTTLLSGYSYFKFFEKSFGLELAFVMALLLACIIEFGKNWGFLRVLRIPFFQGWGHIWQSVQNTILWGGLLALSVVTFSASVYNSTKGAQQLSLLLGHEKNAATFSPNTADIDQQIAATEKRIAENRQTKWKNTTTVDAMRAIKTESRTLETLQKQRADRIAQQRADYERETGIKDNQNQFSAGTLMAVGGWVELLQIILMFIRVSAEKSLDRTASQRRTQNATTLFDRTQGSENGFIQYQQNGVPATKNASAAKPRVFYVQNTDKNTVPQPLQTVPQQNADNYADSVLEVCRQAVQRDLSNFDNRQANNNTVARRIHAALDTALEAMRAEGFNPTYKTGAKLYHYLQEKVWQRLNEVGHPYESQQIFTHRLYAVFTADMPA